MDHFRLRKYRGPETWAKVKEAYLAGEPAAAVARRFDVGLANVRKKASREGWTRHAMALRHDLKPVRGDRDAPPPAIGPLSVDPAPDAAPDRADPPPGVAPLTAIDPLPGIEPEAAREAGIRHAAALIAAGRGSEALSLLKAVQGLARTLETAPAWDDGAEPEPEAFDYAALEALSLEMAVKNAEAMLGDTGYGITGAFGHAAYHWRAHTLGPEIARHDYEQGLRGHWADAYWEADGTLKPLEGPFDGRR